VIMPVVENSTGCRIGRGGGYTGIAMPVGNVAFGKEMINKEIDAQLMNRDALVLMARREKDKDGLLTVNSERMGWADPRRGSFWSTMERGAGTDFGFMTNTDKRWFKGSDHKYNNKSDGIFSIMNTTEFTKMSLEKEKAAEASQRPRTTVSSRSVGRSHSASVLSGSAAASRVKSNVSRGTGRNPDALAVEAILRSRAQARATSAVAMTRKGIGL